MNISSLRARIRSLRRRLALPYAQLMVQRAAGDLCTQWACARADKRPTPSPQAFVRRVAAAGFLLPTFSRPSPLPPATLNGAPLSVRNPARSASFAPSSPGPPITPGCFNCVPPVIPAPSPVIPAKLVLDPDRGAGIQNVPVYASFLAAMLCRFPLSRGLRRECGKRRECGNGASAKLIRLRYDCPESVGIQWGRDPKSGIV